MSATPTPAHALPVIGALPAKLPAPVRDLAPRATDRHWWRALVDPPRLWRALLWAVGVITPFGDPSFTRVVISVLATADVIECVRLRETMPATHVLLYLAAAFGRHSFEKIAALVAARTAITRSEVDSRARSDARTENITVHREEIMDRRRDPDSAAIGAEDTP